MGKTKIKDGYIPERSGGNKRAAGTLVVVGPYRLPISRDRFTQWEEEIVLQVGPNPAGIRAEIVRRLAI